MSTPPSGPVQLPTGPQVPFEAVLTEAVKRIQSPVILGATAFIALLFGGLFLVPGILDKAPALPWGVLGFGLLVLLLVVVPDAYLKARAQALREWREREAHHHAETARPEERLPISSPPPTKLPASQQHVLVALGSLPSPPEPPKVHASSDALRDRYLRYLVDCCAHLQMTTLDLKAATRPEAAQLDLAAVFTDLDVYDVGWEEEVVRKRQEPSLEREQADRRLPTLGAFSRYPRLALLGDPGSGKSTLVNFVTLCLAGDWLNSPDANLRRLGDAWGLPRLLPIRVILRDYAARGLPTNQGLWEFIGAELKCLEPDGPLSGCLPVLQGYLERENGALLLLDGLDEVPEAHRYRLRLKEAVARFVRDFPNCRILVTSRSYAYRPPKDPKEPDPRLSGFEVRTLAPFTPEQVQTFIRRWYEHVGLKDPAFGPHNAARYAERLANEVKTRPRLADLAPNPLLLTLMASLHRWQEGGSLPERRQELYEQSVKLLIDLWQRPKQLFDAEGNPAGQEYDVFTELGISQDALRGALNWAAYEAHKEQPDLTGTHDIRARVLAGALYEAATDKGKARGEQRIIQYLIDRAGLLIEREQGRVYTFPHRTFQEYLAASYLADENYPYLLLERLQEEDARWREAALLAAAKAGRSGIWHLAETFCPHDWSPSVAPTDSDWYAALRAAQALIEVEPQPLREPSERQRRLVERLRAWLAALAETGRLPAPERAAAGDALARLLYVPATGHAAGGDPRPGVGLLPSPSQGEGPGVRVPDILWCYVPPGSFQMGSQDDPDAYPDEQPQHEQNTGGYYIARYPVTNAQFQAFVDDGEDGYTCNDRWTRAGLSWRGDRTRPEMMGGVYDLPNHPAVMITWYEVVAWCNWLTDKLRVANSGWQIRLPSEAEWEKAARGGLEIPANPIIVNTLPSATPDPKSRIQNPKSTRLYPWGATPELDVPHPNRANYAETGIGTTCAVGIFPQGRSPYGCLDLSGNVWEWCATRWVDNYENYGKREDNNLEGSDRRVVRGGAFYAYPQAVRCAYRYGYVPVNLYRHRGFRPVAAPI